MRQVCGNCMYKGQAEGILSRCLVDNKLHDSVFTCVHWIAPVQGISPEARVAMAMDLRSSKETQKAHQEAMGINIEANSIARSAKNASWWALGIAIVSAIISLAAILKR